MFYLNGNACSILDTGRERIVGKGWAKEMAISSYSGWNIVFNVSILFDSPLLDIKLSRVQERAELQFRCQAQLAYPPYTLQLMRNYCRT